MNRQQRRNAQRQKSKTPAQKPTQSPLAFLQNLSTAQSQQTLKDGERLIRAALEREPERAEYWMALAQLCRLTGAQESAEDAFRRAVLLQPDYLPAHRDLANTKKFRDPADDDLARMLTAEKNAVNAAPQQRCHIYFALGKAFADLGDFDRAFAAFDTGNRLLRSTYSYDIAGLERYFEEIAEIFSRDYIAKNSGEGDASSKPIFIVGMPRSGTTLAEQILSSHTEVHGAGELKTLDNILSFLQNGKRESLCNHDFMGKIGAAHYRQIGGLYIREIEKLNPSAARITDKMPFNFMWIGLIRLALPQARIIHCRRDPRDVGVSCFTRMFTELTPWSNDLVEIGRYANAYNKLMRHWDDLFGEAIHTLDYASLVQNPGEETQKLLVSCDLPWQDSCLAFHENRRAVGTASDTQVRQPLYRDALDGWKRYEKHIAPLLDILEAP